MTVPDPDTVESVRDALWYNISRCSPMSVVIPDEIMEAARLSPDELRTEIAVMLSGRGGLTVAQSSRFCGLDRVRFQKILASREIPVNYSVEDFETDLSTVRHLNQP